MIVSLAPNSVKMHTEHVLVASLLGPKNIIDIENIVAILVVIAVVLAPFARLREDSSWITGGLVFEARVAYPVCRRQVNGKRLKGLVKFVSIREAPSFGAETTYTNKTTLRVRSPECRLSVDLGPKILRRPYLPELWDWSFVYEGSR